MSASRPRLVLVGCFPISVAFNAYVIAPANVFPLLVADFGVDKPAAGLAISAVFASWVALQLPGGFLMDRYDNRRLVGVGVLLFAVASVATGAVSSYLAFLAARAAAGVAAVFVWTANANVVARSFPASERAFATSAFVASAPAGFAVSQFVGPLVARSVGWQAVFFLYPLVALVGLPVLVTAADPVRNESALSASAFLSALGHRGVLYLSAGSFCAYSLFLFFNSWMPTYATEELATDLAAAGAAAALVPLSGIVARPGGGWLSDHIGGRRKPVVVAAFVLSIPPLVLLPHAAIALAFAALLLFAGFVSQLGTGVFYVYVAELAPSDAGGTSLAVLTTLSIGGSLVTPVVTGWLIDAVSWTAAFGYAAALAVGGLVLVVAAPST